MAAQTIIVDGMPVAIGGGLDSISLVQPKMVKGVVVDRSLMKTHPALWMPMIDTADIVATRYGIPRERLDEYALVSQQRTAAAQAANLFADEIVPMDVVMMVKDKATGEVSKVKTSVTTDECNKADTTLEGLGKLDIATAVELQRVPEYFVLGRHTIYAPLLPLLLDGGIACTLNTNTQQPLERRVISVMNHTHGLGTGDVTTL